jgi:CRP-like cAMP-binding protein
MPDNSSAPNPNKASPKTPSRDVNGRIVHNKILLGLPGHEFSEISSKLEFVLLPTPIALNEADEPIKYAFFVDDGLASVLLVMTDGKCVEVGLCGLESFVGIPLTAGLSTSSTRTIMQVNGSGFRIKAKDLVLSLPKCPALSLALQRFGRELSLQAEQMAACNRLHEVEERLARWLLMCQDRLGTDTLELTQQFLAHMLGTRRASVTVAAGILQKAGLITYSRGLVKISNRNALEDAVCECYETMKRQTDKWHAEANSL